MSAMASEESEVVNGDKTEIVDPEVVQEVSPFIAIALIQDNSQNVSFLTKFKSFFGAK